MTTGFGGFELACPDAENGHHEWSSPDRRLIRDDGRCCVHCGAVAREFLAAATEARAEFFSTLRAPASAHGKAKK